MKTLTLTIEYEEPVTEAGLIQILDAPLTTMKAYMGDDIGWRYNEDPHISCGDYCSGTCNPCAPC